MTTTPLPIVGRRLGGYEVLYALKTGGMGEVVLARKVGAGGFEKLVAIKTVRTEYRQRDEVRRMFFDEARLVARLQHPAIAQVLDFGDDGGELYLVMEYVQGVRFGWLRDHRPPPAIAARAVAEALRGLHAAHELTDLAGNPLEVVHRDITPENLMLSFDGQVKVLDFGIALARGRQAPVTEFGTIKGKPPYLSPEQVKCEPLDRRTDIFSAAIVLYELLTGEPLFVADSVYAVARMIEHRDVPPPSAIAGPLPDGLDEAVLQGLAKRREERFQTAEAFARALDAVADRAGGESLVEYSRRELAAERERHRAWLRGVLAAVDSGLAEAARRGRASGVMTVPGEGAAEVLE
ncbi:MAG: serine/threonine protein kinase, partial [Deltaproteobacteria bacterium]